MTISSAASADLTEAFALLYGHRPEHVIENTLRAFRLIAEGELDPANILVAHEDDHVAGAVFCQRVAGSSAVVWPPRSLRGDPHIEDDLTRAAIEHAAGVKVMQAFLRSEEFALAAPLLRGGFQHVTRVWNMRREAGQPVPTQGTGVQIRLLRYPECDSLTFREVLIRSHEDSADCPELQGVRSPDEVLAGYREVAPALENWWLAFFEDEPVGNLIFSGEELCFLGVIPQFRGRGIGRSLVQAVGEFAHSISLIVDSRNQVALSLYRAAGFQVVGSHEVLLKLS